MFLWKAGDGTYDYLPQIRGKMSGFSFQVLPKIMHLDEIQSWKN